MEDTNIYTIVDFIHVTVRYMIGLFWISMEVITIYTIVDFIHVTVRYMIGLFWISRKDETVYSIVDFMYSSLFFEKKSIVSILIKKIIFPSIVMFLSLPLGRFVCRLILYRLSRFLKRKNNKNVTKNQFVIFFYIYINAIKVLA